MIWNIIIPVAIVAAFEMLLFITEYRKLRKIRKPGRKYPSATVREIDRLLDYDK